MLIKNGIKLREASAQATSVSALKRAKSNSRPYYGFCYFEGEIMKDPHEFTTLEIIHKLWSEKKTIHQITKDLSRMKLKSRLGKVWSWIAIKKIVTRFETKKIILQSGGKYEFR